MPGGSAGLGPSVARRCDLEIRQLRYFVLAAGKDSFKAAADELFVSRAALSKSVSKLEGELGYALFDRTRDGV